MHGRRVIDVWCGIDASRGLGALAVTVDWLKRDADSMKAMLVRRA